LRPLWNCVKWQIVAFVAVLVNKQLFSRGEGMPLLPETGLKSLVIASERHVKYPFTRKKGGEETGKI